jgi:hypothetical protein
MNEGRSLAVDTDVINSGAGTIEDLRCVSKSSDFRTDWIPLECLGQREALDDELRRVDLLSKDDAVDLHEFRTPREHRTLSHS